MTADRRWKVLLIDDSQLVLDMEVELLSASGFDVRATTALGEFQELLENWLPDLILTDVDMPGLTGVQLCEKLKSFYETSEIPIVLFSSRSNQELASLAQECAADGWLSKADGFDKLSDELRALCETVAW